MSDSSPSVLVFATGGTMGMHETDRGLAPDPTFGDVLDHMVAEICAPLGAEYRINHLSPAIDSANADSTTALRIARAVSARVRTHRPSAVVITHGTDTLAYVAARLAFELAGIGVPVIVTGSQLPHGAEGTDTRANLSLAIRTALRASASAPVSIAFGSTIVPAIRASKFQAEGLDAFRAERPLAPGASGVPKSLQVPERNNPARVITLRFVPGITAADVRAMVGGAPDGLVIECYGSGNAPTAKTGMTEALREIASQVPVLAVTQCTTGAVDFNRYAVGSELAKTGVIDGGDMTLEAAIAKLSFALDAGLSGNTLERCLKLNLVGERQ